MSGSVRPIKRIVLVHGAAHGAWCWELLTPLLEAKGYDVQVLDLPGLGDDPTPPAKVTFADYVASIVDVLHSRPEPALLLGHSMGGGPVSRAAEEAPETVAKLVYLAALMPEDGESAASMRFEEMPQSAAHVIRESTVEGAHEFDPALAADIFYHRSDPEVARWAVSKLRPQADGPVAEVIRLSPARWGAVPKVYIRCTEDRALPPQAQQWLCDRAPDVRQRVMQSDHAPFLSDAPGLAAILDDEARSP